MRAEATAINPIRDDDAPFLIYNHHHRQYHSSMKYSSKEEVESLSRDDDNNDSISVPKLSVTEVAKALQLVVESLDNDDDQADGDSSRTNNLSNYIYIDCRSKEE